MRGIEAVEGRQGALVTLKDGYFGFETAAEFKSDLADRLNRGGTPPRLIILDLKLENDEEDVHEQYEEIGAATKLIEDVRNHTNAAVRGIPIVVLSNSNVTSDIEISISLGANAFATKGNINELRYSILSIVSFWIGANKVT